MRSVWPILIMAFASAGQVRAGAVEGPAEGSIIANQYIVSLKSDAPTLQAMEEYVQSEADRLTATYGATILFKYSAAFPGVALKVLPDQVEALSNDPAIKLMEADRIVRISAVEVNATAGLDRIDARTGLDRKYNFSKTGKGVNVFVIDTGILRTHQEFTGRVGAGFTAVNDGQGTNDCNGHGSHVSGTIGGTVFGVAKEVTINPVRVLDCNGSGSNSAVIAGLDFVTKHAVKPAVANMSIGGAPSNQVDAAVNAAIQSGIVFAIAAGNDNANACNTSPARVPDAITVGASQTNDKRASFSNFGSCLDIFAPGVNIQSVGIRSNVSTAILSGTSMACPHVAGVAALLLEGAPTATAKEIRDQMIANATPNVVSGAGLNSPNRLLFSNP